MGIELTQRDLGRYIGEIAEAIDLDIFVIDRGGTVLTWTGRLSDRFRLSGKAVGRSIREILPDTVDPELGVDLVDTVFSRVIGSGEARFFRNFLFEKVGREPFQASVVALPIFDQAGKVAGASVMFRDITAEANLRVQMGAILDNAGDGILVMNRNREVVIFNRAAGRMTGQPFEDVRNRALTCDEVIHCDYRGSAHGPARCPTMDIFTRAREGYTEEYTVRDPEGAELWIEARYSAILDREGEVHYVIGILRDITQRKRYEREIEEQSRRLSEALADLKESQHHLIHSEKMATIGRLAAGVAHELNTPLNTILGYAQMLSEQATTPEVREEAGAIEAATKRCRDIVRNLLDFSRKSEGRRAVLDLNKVIGQVFAFLHHDFERRRIPVDLDLSDGPLRIEADENQWQQVFTALAANALDAMPDGGTVTVATRATREGPVEIVFRDTGHGIAPENLGRIFEPFFTTKPPGQGTGLGLSIAYGIVEDHGGGIRVDSAPGRGTAFTIVVPPAPGDGDQVGPRNDDWDRRSRRTNNGISRPTI